VVTLEELADEYRQVGIGPRILGQVREVVRAVARGYDPTIYGASASWDEGLDDLVQEFGLEVLVGQGQLDYAMLVAADHQHFRRLLARQVRYLLARRRRRTIVDNLIDRAHRLAATPPFRLLGQRSQWSYTLVGKEVVAGRVSEAAARSVAARFAELPIIRAEPMLRAPAVYSEASLRTILAELAAAVPCAVGAGDLDRVLSLLLTSWLPCFLKEAEATVANAAAEGLSAEDLAIVEEATMAILTGCESGQLEILRLKLAGRSDEHIAESLGLSRPTVSKRKRAAMGRLEDSLTGLDQPLRLAVLDELGVRLEAARGGLRGKG
jgi:hypothetical protein